MWENFLSINKNYMEKWVWEDVLLVIGIQQQKALDFEIEF